MYSFRYGGKNGKRFSLTTSNDQVVVRTNNRSTVLADRPVAATPVSSEARAILDNFELVTRYREAGVEVLRARVQAGAKGLRNRAGADTGKIRSFTLEMSF